MFKLYTPETPVELTPFLKEDFRNESVRQALSTAMLKTVLSTQKSELVLAHNEVVSSDNLDVTKHELVRPVPTPFYFRNMHGVGQLFLTLDAANPIDPKNFGTPKETFADYGGNNIALILQAGADDSSRKYATIVASAIDPRHPVQPVVYIGAY